VPSVSIGTNRPQIIDLLLLSPLLRRHPAPGLLLPSAVEVLRPQQLIHFVGNRVHWVVGKVRARLVRSGCSRGALPAAHVDRSDIGGHRGNLNGVESAEGVAGLACLLELTKHLVELAGLMIGGGGVWREQWREWQDFGGGIWTGSS
jgi:hypothetical protein